MKKWMIVSLLCLFLCGCTWKEKETLNKPEEKPSQSETDQQPEEETPSIDKKVEEIMSKMSLEEKIGQMIILSYRYPYDSNLENTLKTVKPGGFILFKENISTYEKTLEFIQKMKSTNSIPMFISIDQEGGSVQRLLALEGTPVSNIPYMQQVGATNDSKLAREVGKVIAEELRVFGINMDFAPVLDVYSNPNNTVIGKRAFGTTSDVVSAMGLSLGKGLEENGVIPVYKHFPGHGNTAVDSHYALPVVTKTKEELYSLDLIPFQEAIKNNAEVIMIGHLAVPSITEDNVPASLSQKLITGLLKEEMGFQGLVVTDALEMGALTKYYTEEEIYIKAVEAGVDLLLMPTSSKKAVETIKNAVLNGDLSVDRINESVRKILKLKYEKIEPHYEEYLPKDYLANQEHQDILNQIG